MDMSFPDGRSSQMIAVLRHDSGRRVQLRLNQRAEQALLGLRTGSRIEANGIWVASRADEANPGRRPSLFKADDLQDVGPAWNPPPPMETPYVPPPEQDTYPLEQELLGQGRRLQQAASAIVSVQNPLTVGNMRVLFIRIQHQFSNGTFCPGSSKPLLSGTEFKEKLFSTTTTSVAQHFNECSFGRTLLTNDSSLGATSFMPNIVTLPCSGSSYGVNWNASTCNFDDYDGIAEAANQVLIGRGLNITAYPYRVYMLPPNSCSFLGLGYIGCDGSYDCRAWVTGNSWDDPQVAAHELGHNLFMQHAGYLNPKGFIDEYGDTTCQMGQCCDNRCLNTPHAWQVGWLSLRQLNGTSLPASATYNTTLSIGSMSQNNSGIRIVPTWAPGVDPIFVSFRWAVRGDAYMNLTLSNRVHIYTSKISNSRDPQPTLYRAPLRVGEPWTLPAANLVIRRSSSTSTTLAVVQICRRGGLYETAASCAAGIDNNCDGLAGTDDPMCLAYL